MTVDKYIRSIRNIAKRAYAKNFAEWLSAGEPEGKEPETGNLSYMGAQSVRMQLRELNRGT